MAGTSPKVNELKVIISSLTAPDEKVHSETTDKVMKAKDMNSIEKIMCTDRLKRILDDAIGIYFRS